MEVSNSGPYIRKNRKLKNLSQEELAVLVGVSRNTISDWENDKVSIKYENAEVLAEVFGVTAPEVMVGKDLTGLDSETRQAISMKFKELSEQVDSVNNVTINIEDRGILTLDVAVTALSFAFFATAMGIQAVFPHTTLNRVCCIVIAVLGVVVMVFGRKIIRMLDKQLKERIKDMDESK